MGALTSCACDSCGCPDDVPLSNKPETYSVPATESSNDSYTRDQLEPPKNKKKRKKRKQNAAVLQHEIMQKAKNEVDKHAASTSLYDMDSKTVQLLMTVDLNASQDGQVPQPSMPSIPSLDFDREPEISDLPDMSTALRSYTSSHMYDAANDFSAPDTFLTANNTFQQDVKDVSYERIASMQNLVAQTPRDMVTIIAAQYGTDKHVETDESQSSLEEDERHEIEQRKEDLNKRKHEKTMSVSQAKLFRMGTVTQWTGNAMEDMGGAIKKEIEAMRSGYDLDTDIDLDADDLVTDEDFDDKQMEIDRKSALYRMKSARKWTTQRVERENEDMQAQLTHLMVAHQSSIESDGVDPMKQAEILPLPQNKQ